VTPRKATLEDVEMLAQLHVQAWHECYAGLLPETEIATRDLDYRRKIWTKIMKTQIGRVWLIDDLGFAHFGPNREEHFRDQGYPEELFAMYLIRPGYGLGSVLIKSANGREGQPFTACVLDGNARACAFYEKSGGVHLTTRAEHIGSSKIQDRVYGWTDAPFAN